MVGKKEDRQATLREWLRQFIGRGKGKLPGKELAARLGVHPSRVSDMLKPGGRIIKAHEMRTIIDFIGRRPPPDVWDDSTEAEAQTGARMTPVRARVRIVGANTPGLWREKDAERAYNASFDIAEDDDPRLEGLDQYAIWVEQPRKYAVCVDYARVFQRPMADHDVHVLRTNAAGQVEETIRRIEITRGKVRLTIVGQAPKGVEKSIAYPSVDPAETIEIKGLVVGVYEKKF